MPPELLARRRAATPSSTPYQPIAGWSMPPTGSVGLPPAPGTGAFTQPTAATGPAQTGTSPVGTPAQPLVSGPVNGFASPPPGGGQPGPASSPALAAPRSDPGPGGRQRRSVLLGAGALAVVGALAISGLLWANGRNDDATTPTPTATPSAAAAPVELKFDVSSYDPSGGSGFELKGSAWKTQTYKNLAYAGLKPGVGLVFDLGSAREIRAVTFNAETGPLTVELRSADEPPAGGSDGDRVGKAVSADGKTTLDGSKGGKHQYWMVWVTKLASSNQCVKPAPQGCAAISDLSVTASAAS